MTTRPGRGRPVTFDEPMRDKYLAAVADGMTLTEAAEHLGIHRNTATLARRTDRQFAAALADARTRGRETRQENVPHGEYRYNILGCRCTTCRTAHTKARAGRRAATDTQQTTGEGELVDLHHHPVAESVLSPLLLARAS